jgi:hypothetical protein
VRRPRAGGSRPSATAPRRWPPRDASARNGAADAASSRQSRPQSAPARERRTIPREKSAQELQAAVDAFLSQPGLSAQTRRSYRLTLAALAAALDAAGAEPSREVIEAAARLRWGRWRQRRGTGTPRRCGRSCATPLGTGCCPSARAREHRRDHADHAGDGPQSLPAPSPHFVPEKPRRRDDAIADAVSCRSRRNRAAGDP